MCMYVYIYIYICITILYYAMLCYTIPDYTILYYNSCTGFTTSSTPLCHHARSKLVNQQLSMRPIRTARIRRTKE